jgi:hypothetical protein
VIVYKDGNGHVEWETAADALTRIESVVHQINNMTGSRRSDTRLPVGEKITTPN